jgi:phage shock protein C
MAGPEPSGRRRLSRSRSERLLFGVAGGIAEYFAVDPALVRIGFVLAGIFPPTSAISVIGYLLLTVILPEADAEELAGRDQLRRNLQGLRSEVEQMTESVRSNLSGLGIGGTGARRERETVDMSDVEVTDVTVPSERAIERAAEYPPERSPSAPSAPSAGTTSSPPTPPGPGPSGPTSPAGTATKAPSSSADGSAEPSQPSRP